jgi:hypothetical protein
MSVSEYGTQKKKFDEPINPDVCVCMHLKQEHGGKLTDFFKKLPGTSSLIAKLAQERLTNSDMPRPKKVYACMLCNCKQFKSGSEE